MNDDVEVSATSDPFESLTPEQGVVDFRSLVRELTRESTCTPVPAAVTAQLCGFDLDERPLVCGLSELPGEIVWAQTVIPLLRDQIGSRVVVLFDRGDVRCPIVVGVLQQAGAAVAQPAASLVAIRSDDQSLVLSAEKQIELRCGEASITLTRAGKVLIKGKYILSCSSGHNRIQGAAVDIN
ncbi:MAG: hypothetical protein QOI59_6651 [Gammaproteobacteria bacterium]|jgi:hypothetical protein|nr:hypothetical protein [Gammaproteobacteria bacterium]